MKSSIIIGLVIAAVVAVIAVKASKKECGTPEQTACCPCSMIEVPQSNEVPQGVAPVE
jgi:hypothetical protein